MNSVFSVLEYCFISFFWVAQVLFYLHSLSVSLPFPAYQLFVCLLPIPGTAGPHSGLTLAAWGFFVFAHVRDIADPVPWVRDAEDQLLVRFSLYLLTHLGVKLLAAVVPGCDWCQVNSASFISRRSQCLAIISSSEHMFNISILDGHFKSVFTP